MLSYPFLWSFVVQENEALLSLQSEHKVATQELDKAIVKERDNLLYALTLHVTCLGHHSPVTAIDQCTVGCIASTVQRRSQQIPETERAVQSTARQRSPSPTTKTWPSKHNHSTHYNTHTIPFLLTLTVSQGESISLLLVCIDSGNTLRDVWEED